MVWCSESYMLPTLKSVEGLWRIGDKIEQLIHPS